MKMPRRYFSEFDTYHKSFRKYKWLLWVGLKLGLIPYTFYKKYTI
jgi:hypothetical protein